ncbi:MULTISPECIES: type II toxin-antitoxin system VapC family toxin [unclassified Rhizobium]|uniref:type II toxin-antitoxin system VapC family toxin n=1 Tax=unclassified Rhizobium TaxID=2613769 RepID=UPI001ADCE08D|nr:MULTISPECIES: type II toxin-antitoxin system VapC family toxin [unclassified Rhizobium]MBO9127723.1 type II toxin-antitoxin system VapC family toxin [Rhizobium sp. 16-488-2b]MBO9178185.1 type II toxin-antitoxin system VapC family toxin [Rhizobium sp. 16-488-2a]
MIAVDTSVIIAIAADEPEAEVFRPLLGREPVIIGWPTLLEVRMVLTGKGFASAAKMIKQLAETPNVTTVVFDEKHYRAAEDAFERFGRGRHVAALNMGDCFSYAVATLAKAPLLFKGHDFGRTDLKLHPASSMI